MSSTRTQMAASLAVLVSLVCTALASGAAGVRVDLTRLHAGPGVTASQFMRDALRRDMHRHHARQLAASDGTVSAPTRKDPSFGEYLMTLAIGTPPVSYPAIADTGSDLIWTQCAPCGSQCFKQPTPLYNPANSTTFGDLPLCNNSTSASSMCAAALAGAAPPPGCACPYNQTYGIGWTSGFLESETFTFGSASADQTSVPNITFGCSNASSDGNDNNGWAGLVGLGRGAHSLVSQLGADRFSYCLTSFGDTNSTSTLLLGPSAALNDTGVRSTPFVTSPAMAGFHYYLNLTGISLGTNLLSIPPDAFSIKSDGTSGGFVIDSGTTLTYLPDVAYQPIRAAVLSLVTLPTADGSGSGYDLCFALPSATAAPPDMPSMTLHFDGADMVLPVENYMITDTDIGLWCLIMQNTTLGDGLPSILGNYQQQNMHILYDVGQEILSFAPAECSTL